MTAPVLVVGIGADGWDGLSARARREIRNAEVLMGSRRQLDLVPSSGARRVAWPTPLLPALPPLLDAHRDARVCVLASGDPMFHGIGVTLVRLLGAARVRVIPHPSSVALACARMGWAAHETPTVSLVNRPVPVLAPALLHGARLMVLSNDQHTPAQVAQLLRERGFGDSRMVVLEQLGGPAEAIVDGTAHEWRHPPGDPLNVIALDCVARAGTPRLTRLPGLPDDAYRGDGQMTKQELRALTLCALAPAPGELLWDVGGGSGTIAIEWMRTDARCRAVSFERHPARVAQITANAAALGVPTLQVRGDAPASFAGAPAPDAIFVGGGVSQDGLLEACWSRLRPGGRLVANAVTAESESLLLHWFTRAGGRLRKFQIYRAEPLGGFTGWRPQLPVVQWSTVKETIS